MDTKERVKRLRALLGWSQTDLARHMDVTDRQVQRWENGSARPYPRHLEKLAELEEGFRDRDASCEGSDEAGAR
jgi:transcriptional regulator with XRE-family HTH domain